MHVPPFSSWPWTRTLCILDVEVVANLLFCIGSSPLGLEGIVGNFIPWGMSEIGGKVHSAGGPKCSAGKLAQHLSKCGDCSKQTQTVASPSRPPGIYLEEKGFAPPTGVPQQLHRKNTPKWGPWPGRKSWKMQFCSTRVVHLLPPMETKKPLAHTTCLNKSIGKCSPHVILYSCITSVEPLNSLSVPWRHRQSYTAVTIVLTIMLLEHEAVASSCNPLKSCHCS